MNKPILLLFLLILLSILFVVYLSKSKNKKSGRIIGKVVKITPAFKATNKIEFEYTVGETVYQGFTLANEQVNYIQNERYEILIDPSNPKDARLTPVKTKP